MPKLTGLHLLSQQLKDAQVALTNLDGKLGTVQFTADYPASIEAAIVHVNAMVDERLGPYADNPIVAPLISSMKEKYREAVIERAAAMRLEGKTGDDV